MALIACHECNGRVSDSATACPHCGAPVRLNTRFREPAATRPDVLSRAERTANIKQHARSLGIAALVMAIFYPLGFFIHLQNVSGRDLPTIVVILGLAAAIIVIIDIFVIVRQVWLLLKTWLAPVGND